MPRTLEYGTTPDGRLIVWQVNDDGAGAGSVATTVDLYENGKTATNVDHPPPATEKRHTPPTTKAYDNTILYGLEDCPSWYLCIFLGFQVISSVTSCRCLKQDLLAEQEGYLPQNRSRVSIRVAEILARAGGVDDSVKVS